jgi:hypothetical protein
MPLAPLATLLLLAGAAAPAPGPALGRALLDAVAAARLDLLLDAGPTGECPGAPLCPLVLQPVAAVPHLDLAVIRLDGDGRALDAAEVILDPDSPAGRVVPLDRNLAPLGLRHRRWSQERREAWSSAEPFSDADDLVPGARPGGRDFMEPYPASLFKLLVAFHVARRATEGALDLGEPLRAPNGGGGEVRPAREWLERMMTLSDNPATRAVLAWLHRRGEVDRMNRGFVALGLPTLRVDGTRREDGARWAPGEIHAGALDVARLLWLVAGGPGVSWRTPAGRRVTSAALPEPARALLRDLLADQANHDVLSSGSLCGDRPAGIPALVPERWLDPETGAEAGVNALWRRDVRPCNAGAEVTFAHKTGLTWNYASDAGIVESLPGASCRRYVVALVASAGSRYLDPESAAVTVHPCAAEGACVTRRLAALGARIDRIMVEAFAADGNRGGCAARSP